MSKRSNWSIPYAIFLVFFVVLPLVLVMVYAFQDSQGHFTLGNLAKFFTDKDALSTFAVSIEVALENTALCILLGYPAAWILANKQYNKSAVTIVLFIMPMWINALMRTLATAQLFTMLGITLGKGTLLFGMVYDYLPFMIYPIYNVLAKMDKSYAEAAVDLGATPWTAFWKVTVPLSMPGVTSSPPASSWCSCPRCPPSPSPSSSRTTRSSCSVPSSRRTSTPRCGTTARPWRSSCSSSSVSPPCSTRTRNSWKEA